MCVGVVCHQSPRRCRGRSRGRRSGGDGDGSGGVSVPTQTRGTGARADSRRRQLRRPTLGAGVRSLRRATWGGGPGTGQDQHRPKCGQAARIQTPSWLPSRLSLSAPPAMDASSPELRTSILDWDENDVHAWLTKLGFPQYEQQVKGTSAQYPSVDTNSPRPPSRAQHIRRCPMPS